MAVLRTSLVAAFSVLVIVNPASAQCQLDKLLADDGQPGDAFGFSVAIREGLAVIGAVVDDDRAFDSGSAYVFAIDAEGRATQVAKLLPTPGGVQDFFGYSVAAGADLAIAGTPGDGFAGAVYVFEPSGDTWTQTGKLLPNGASLGANFGWDVAISGDLLVGGAPRDSPAASGSGFVFERQKSGTWVQTAKLKAADPGPTDFFGMAADVCGNTIVVGALSDDERGCNAGAAYVFERDGNGQWLQTAKLLAADGDECHAFGADVAVSGDRILVGAEDQDDFRGAAYVFERVDGEWLETAKLLASDGAPPDQFGEDLDLDGDVAIIGAFYDSDFGEASGSAYLFRRVSQRDWIEVAKLNAADAQAGDIFGRAVALERNTALISAWGDDDNGVDSGSAYVFRLTDRRADVDCDGAVGFADLLALLDAWGRCPKPPAHCLADLDDNGTVSFADLLILLATWG